MKDNWDKINWSKCQEYVQRIQHGIVLAVRTGDARRIKSLQRRLVRSFSGRAIAVKYQSRKKGRNTPGIDNNVWKTNNDKYNAINLLGRKDYEASPVRRVFIPKPGNKLRQLSIPTLLDRTMQTLYSMALDPVSETTGDRCSYGFRKERSTIDAIHKCYEILSKSRAPIWILKADIEGCFDNIGHDWIMKNVQINKRVLRSWLKAGFDDEDKRQDYNCGIPQGGNISSIFMNIALNGMERSVRVRDPNAAIVRYADDFIIATRRKWSLVKDVIPVVKEFLSKRNLRLSEEKTKIIRITDGFDFLGQNIKKQNGKILIRPTKESVRKILTTICEFAEKNMRASQYILINELNLKVAGWLQYHKHINSRKEFKQIECRLRKICWKWAIFRNPGKSKKWLKRRYFFRKKTFVAVLKRPRRKIVFLCKPTKMKHCKYIKIDNNYNPYDPAWSTYITKLKHLREKAQSKLILHKPLR
jgi:RNA-directed DNA polymerase